MQQRSIQTKNRIMDAAILLFSKDGYQATGIAEICETANVSKGAFYHHFQSKQSIFIAILHAWLEGIDTSLNTSRDSSSSIPEAFFQMSLLLEGIFNQASGHLPMFLEFWTQANHDPLVWHELIEPYHRYRNYFGSLFQEGVTKKTFKPVDPDIAAHALVSLALGLLLQSLLDPEGAQWGNVSHQTINLFLEGLKINKKE